MGAGNRGLHPCIACGCRSHANHLAAWIDIQQIILFDASRRSSLACDSLFGRTGRYEFRYEQSRTERFRALRSVRDEFQNSVFYLRFC